jgi:hypothetical protein
MPAFRTNHNDGFSLFISIPIFLFATITAHWGQQPTDVFHQLADAINVPAIIDTFEPPIEPDINAIDIFEKLSTTNFLQVTPTPSAEAVVTWTGAWSWTAFFEFMLIGSAAFAVWAALSFLLLTICEHSWIFVYVARYIYTMMLESDEVQCMLYIHHLVHTGLKKAGNAISFTGQKLAGYVLKLSMVSKEPVMAAQMTDSEELSPAGSCDTISTCSSDSDVVSCILSYLKHHLISFTGL